MKNIKKIIIVVVILLIYSLIMYLIFNKNNIFVDNSKNNNNSNNQNSSSNSNSSDTPVDKDKRYFLVIDNQNLRFDGEKWYDAIHDSIQNYGKFIVYTNNKLLGKYHLKMGKVWNLFDDDNNFVNYDGKLLAFSENFNPVVREYNVRTINEEERNYLSSNYKITSFNEMTTNEVIEIDLDKNNQMDKVICISNQNDGNNNDHFSILIVILNGKIYNIINEVGKDSNYVLSIYSIVNILNDKIDSLIVTKTENYIGDSEVTSNSVYRYKNNTFSVD